MTLRRGWLFALLVVLPACFDPIVGSKCADGYSLCGNRCVVTGTCEAVDAAVPPDLGVAVDTTAEDIGSVIDAGVPPGDDAPAAADGGVADQATPTLDVAAPDDTIDVPAEADLGSDLAPDTRDASTTPDVPLGDDARDDAVVVPPLLEDAGADAGVDATTLDTSIDVPDDGPSSVGMDADNGEASASLDADQIDAEPDGPLVCSPPAVNCNEQCVDLTVDPENCGACNTICATGVCNASACLVCGPDESVCGRQCLNTSVDPDNCGGCGIPCASGLCSNGVCEAAGTGRIIVAGHDYLRNRPAMNRILGNAVFLWPVNPVHVLVYEGAANATAIAGADGAIAQVAAATGRQWVRTPVSAADVPAALASTNVFLVYGQEGADDTTLNQLGTDWQSALSAFVNAGGTVVILDGAYAANHGAEQIVSQAGLFLVARNVSATNSVCTVVARGDALASGLPRTYLCEQNSTSLTVSDPATAAITSVVETAVVEAPDAPVVVHKVF